MTFLGGRMKHIDMMIRPDSFHGCIKCHTKISEGACILVSIDGAAREILLAEKDATCPNCGDVKTNTTPAIFRTVEAAQTHINMVREKFESGNQDFSIRLQQFGVLSAGSSAVN
jgi:hypothetical protein